MRVLGPDQELYDVLHEVFARALAEIGALEQSDRLGSWLTSIAIFTARGHIRRRQRQRWLRFFAPEELPEPVAPQADEDVHGALRSTYAILDRIPAEERITFSLRFIEGMQIGEIATACSISTATVKRRLARAEDRFAKFARRDPNLAEWMADREGGR
jgi:RNA polymerase sigma-70 factor (ECF subfamily)